MSNVLDNNSEIRALVVEAIRRVETLTLCAEGCGMSGFVDRLKPIGQLLDKVCELTDELSDGYVGERLEDASRSQKALEDFVLIAVKGVCPTLDTIKE